MRVPRRQALGYRTVVLRLLRLFLVIEAQGIRGRQPAGGRRAVRHPHRHVDAADGAAVHDRWYGETGIRHYFKGVEPFLTSFFKVVVLTRRVTFQHALPSGIGGC